MVTSHPIYNLDQIRNKDTLNIFSDASTRRGPYLTTAACYGVVAVCRDTILDKIFRVHSETTVNAEELRGIRGSLRLALAHCHEFNNINIFSDSLISINDIRNFNKYRYNEETHTIYTNYNKKKPLANQSLVIEIAQLIIELYKRNPEVNFNIYHQKGHISYNNYTNLQKAAKRFRTLNKISQPIDLNMMRYIAIYNDLVDHESRSLLMKTNVFNNVYKDPITFFAIRKITL